MENATKKNSDARLRANAKFQKEKMTSYTFRLSNNVDNGLIERLKNEPNKAGLIKEL